MANSILNVRLQERVDTWANWSSIWSTFKPLAGEPLVIILTSAGDVNACGAPLIGVTPTSTNPIALRKTGDGVHTAEYLPWDGEHINIKHKHTVTPTATATSSFSGQSLTSTGSFTPAGKVKNVVTGVTDTEGHAHSLVGSHSFTADYTPEGEVSVSLDVKTETKTPTFTGDPLNSTGTFTPEGSVGGVVTGVTEPDEGHSHELVGSASTTAEYTPAGSVDVRLDVTPSDILPTFEGSATTSTATYKPTGEVTITTDTSPEYFTGQVVTTSTATSTDYKPDGSVEASFTGTEGTATGKFTPAGSVNAPFSGTAATISVSGTPKGSNSTPDVTVTPSVTSVLNGHVDGTLPSFTRGSFNGGSFTQGGFTQNTPSSLSASVANNKLTLNFTTGTKAVHAADTFQAATHAADTFSAGTKTTFTSTNVLDGVEVDVAAPAFTGSNTTFTGSYTPAGTIAATFSGTEGNISATYTPTGNVSATFTGTKATITHNYEKATGVTTLVNQPVIKGATFAGDEVTITSTGTPQGNVTGFSAITAVSVESATFAGEKATITGTATLAGSTSSNKSGVSATTSTVNITGKEGSVSVTGTPTGSVSGVEFVSSVAVSEEEFTGSNKAVNGSVTLSGSTGTATSNVAATKADVALDGTQGTVSVTGTPSGTVSTNIAFNAVATGEAEEV